MNDQLNHDERATLLDVARRSIEHGLLYGRALAVDVRDYPASLQAQRASFITLHLERQLRGCIGALQAALPLVRDVAEHAYAAAFEDPRFTPLSEVESARVLQIHIAVLSVSEPFPVDSEADLLQRLRPGIDGLTLYYRERRGTFLPAVWESVPDAREFVAHLKYKAGLDQDFWSEELRFERYTTESFPD